MLARPNQFESADMGRPHHGQVAMVERRDSALVVALRHGHHTGVRAAEWEIHVGVHQLGGPGEIARGERLSPLARKPRAASVNQGQLDGTLRQSARSDSETGGDGTGVKALVPHRHREVRRAERKRTGKVNGVSPAELMRQREQTSGLLDVG